MFEFLKSINPVWIVLAVAAAAVLVFWLVKRNAEERAACSTAVIGDAASQEELNDEILAVIAAAIYSYYGEDAHKKVAIKSVRRVPTGANPWAAAGLAQNMRGL